MDTNDSHAPIVPDATDDAVGAAADGTACAVAVAAADAPARKSWLKGTIRESYTLDCFSPCTQALPLLVLECCSNSSVSLDPRDRLCATL